MDEYEMTEEDEYESRYADELELLNDFEEEPTTNSVGPRKALVFPETSDTQETEVTESKTEFRQSIKRQMDDMYAAVLSDNDSDDEIIDQIYNNTQGCQAKRVKISDSPTKDTTLKACQDKTPSDNTMTENIPKTRVYTRPLQYKECICVTGCDKGRRVYLALNKENHLEEKENKSFLKRKPSNLLGLPFSVLKERIHEHRTSKLLVESERLTETLNSVINNEIENDDNNNNAEIKEKDLWVDKYSPKTYVELLSDDGINRNLLSWLKLWDPVVFGKDKPKRKQANEVKLKQEKKDKKFNKFKKFDETDWLEVDATGRPVYKITLLCGPPGLGKTTLAHIVAQHAGYSVVEMNASDDRSVDVFRNKIESTTQMQSVLDSGKKPNCLIIDEIDGAPTPAINVLLSYIKKKDKDGVIPNEQTVKKKKRKKPDILSRPIICICNDPYVPALRQLRQQAFVLTFPPTLCGRLAQRLYQVSQKEEFQADMSTLLVLCEKAENDIRSCLNTLQFLRNKQERLTVDFVKTANIGQKDTHKSLFSIWQTIFELPRQKKRKFDSLPNVSHQNPSQSLNPIKEISTNAARFYNILTLAAGNAQYSKLENGIFENYLNMKFRDSHLNLVVMATEWFEFADEISQSLRQQQNFVLMRYQPFLSVVFHMYFAAHAQPRISYPSAGYENSVKETKMVNVISTMLHDVSPHLRGELDTSVVAVQLMPYLLNIITPTLRPVNTQLYSENEKRQLSNLIDTMIAYNLTYNQERTMEGLYTYTLDPKVEEVIVFPGLPQHKQLTYATKQFIAREITLEKMRRIERVVLRAGSNSDAKTKSNQNTKNKSDDKTGAVVLELKPKEIKPCVDKQETDFFGRPIKPKQHINSGNAESTTTLKNSTPQSQFWFKFQEGFSNAVRRNIKIKDLL